MVERRDQPDVLGQQHPVAEHVTGHVADADDGEVLGLAVVAQLAEVPLDRLPRAAGGDAHRLVVVAGRAAGGERVAQPEAVLASRPRSRCRRTSPCPCRRRPPDRRRRRRSGPRPRGGTILPGNDVVGDVEQPGDERLVRRDALGQPGVPVDRRVGQLLGVEAALRADRHDHRVLHHLRLHQTEHLGAEVLAPVRPAQTAARDRAEAQVHAFDPRRVHEDLVRRPRLRQVRDRLRLELDRDVRPAARPRRAGSSWSAASP